jgi:arsenate reductase
MSMTTIYHNPRCSKSRQTLALLEEKGIEPDVVLYLKEPPSSEQIADLLGQLGLSARELMRTGEDLYKEQQLDDASLTEQDLIQAMSEHPRLIQRPIVVHDGKAALGRPPEQVLALFS